MHNRRTIKKLESNIISFIVQFLLILLLAYLNYKNFLFSQLNIHIDQHNHFTYNSYMFQKENNKKKTFIITTQTH